MTWKKVFRNSQIHLAFRGLALQVGHSSHGMSARVCEADLLRRMRLSSAQLEATCFGFSGRQRLVKSSRRAPQRSILKRLVLGRINQCVVQSENNGMASLGVFTYLCINANSTNIFLVNCLQLDGNCLFKHSNLCISSVFHDK